MNKLVREIYKKKTNKLFGKQKDLSQWWSGKLSVHIKETRNTLIEEVETEHRLSVAEQSQMEKLVNAPKLWKEMHGLLGTQIAQQGWGEMNLGILGTSSMNLELLKSHQNILLNLQFAITKQF